VTERSSSLITAIKTLHCYSSLTLE